MSEINITPKKVGKWVDGTLQKFYVDNEEDINFIDVTNCCAGSIAHIINDHKTYMLSNTKEWILQVSFEYDEETETLSISM